MTSCIVCGHATAARRTIGHDEITASLESYFDSPIDGDVAIDEYRLLSCSNCTLEFADPMRPGSGPFYRWITSRPGYYPSFRWEFDDVVKRLREAAAAGPIEILDVGCGGGDFLALAKDITGVTAVGIDTTPESVAHCVARGIDARCTDLAGMLASEPGHKFDFVLSFHCIEHVDDPRGFVAEMAQFLKPNGALVISAPLSPMSFETSWFDPLNHPPHHLSRWSVKALQALASELGLEISLTTSPAGSAIGRALKTLQFRSGAIAKPMSKPAKIAMALGSPGAFLGEWKAQRERPLVDGSSQGDTFLAIMTRRS